MRRLQLIACVFLLLGPSLAGHADTTAQKSKKSKKLVTVTKHKLVLAQGIHFDTNKATIQKSSLPALDATAKILKSNKKMRLQIEVHSDSRGSSSYNRRLSQARAGAIAKYLAGKGVKAKRLVPKGFGEDAPIADNRTAAGRAKNRRIELVILDR